MQVEVIPAFRLPRTKASFTYSVPKELEGRITVGLMVHIPWRNSIKHGIISQVHQNVVFEGAKPIAGILEEEPSFSQSSVDTLREIAKHYFCSPSTILMQYLPEKPKKKRSERQTPSTYSIPELRVHRSVLSVSKKIITSSNLYQNIQLQSESERFFFIRQVISSKKRGIIICPTYHEAEVIFSYLQTQFEGVTFWDNRYGKNQIWDTWQQIKSGKSLIVVGTLSALFCPIKDPVYILDGEDRSEHKRFEGSPALDARDVIRIAARTMNTELYELAFTPQISFEPPVELSQKQPYPIHVKHREKKFVFVPDFEDLVSHSSKESPLCIVIPALGTASALYCPECEHTWRCSTCKTKLRVESDKLHCMVCDAKYQLPLRCNGCGGYEIRSIGVGLTGLKEKIEKDFRKSVGVFTANEHQQVDAEVILITPYQLKRYFLEHKKKPSAVYLYHPEQLLYSPEYSAQWQFYSYIMWHRMISELYAASPFYLQTDLDVSHKLLQMLLQNQYHEFREQELNQRKQFMHPPYSEYLSVYSKSKLSLPTEFLGPYISKKDGYRYILKVENDRNYDLDKMLGSSYSKVKIDRNPDRIIFIPKESHA